MHSGGLFFYKWSCFFPFHLGDALFPLTKEFSSGPELSFADGTFAECDRRREETILRPFKPFQRFCVFGTFVC